MVTPNRPLNATSTTPPPDKRPKPRSSKGSDEPRGNPGTENNFRGWTFLTNHAHVMLCLAHGESLTARELSLRIGITERSVQAILNDLTEDGYLLKSKAGRRNNFTINTDGRLRHPLESAHTIGALIEALK